MFRRVLLLGVLGSGAGWMGALQGPRALGSGEEGARLLLVVTVDQMRFDYLERLRGVYSGGLKRLLEEGIAFKEAYQDHAVTSTAPGHSSLATGVFPGRAGMVDNSWFDRRQGETVNCVEDLDSPLLDGSGDGRSPVNLRVDTLADWIKQRDPEAKVFAASRKDRGAILTAGHRADGAFWYDSGNGRFVTSRYYMDSYPAWMEVFFEREIPRSYFGRPWTPLGVSPEVVARGEFEGVESGVERPGFPKNIGSASFYPDSRFFSDFGGTPYMDGYLLEFGKALIESERLGESERLDFLGLSFSALDSVGHSYGPNSRETLDALLRLDQFLGELFDFLDQRVGMERVAVVLSADHGVQTLPEYLTERRQVGRRLGVDDILCFQNTIGELEKGLGEDDWLLSGLYLNYETIGRRNLLRADVEAKLARLLQRCPAVARVWTRTQLEGSSDAASQDPFARLYRNSFDSERSPDLYLQLKEFHLGASAYGTSHGSPYEYDRHVALVFRIPGFEAKQIETRVRTVDVAPTLASILGIPVPDDLDGVDLSGLLRRGQESALPGEEAAPRLVGR